MKELIDKISRKFNIREIKEQNNKIDDFYKQCHEVEGYYMFGKIGVGFFATMFTCFMSMPIPELRKGFFLPLIMLILMWYSYMFAYYLHGEDKVTNVVKYLPVSEKQFFQYAMNKWNKYCLIMCAIAMFGQVLFAGVMNYRVGLLNFLYVLVGVLIVPIIMNYFALKYEKVFYPLLYIVWMIFLWL